MADFEKELVQDRLYIPMGIKMQKEYFSGFGKKEARQTAICAIVINVFNIIAFVISGSLTSLMVVFLLSLAAPVMFLTKDANTNISIVDTVNHLIRFSKSQKKYPYRYRKEW